MRRDKVKRVSLILFGIIFLYSSSAYANAALPLVFLSLPGMALALVPVIAMESYVLMKILGLSMGSGLAVVFVAESVEQRCSRRCQFTSAPSSRCSLTS